MRMGNWQRNQVRICIESHVWLECRNRKVLLEIVVLLKFLTFVTTHYLQIKSELLSLVRKVVHHLIL